MTKLFYCPILLLFFSCTLKKEKPESFSNEYLRLKKTFRGEMVFHFPEKIASPANFIHYSPTAYTYSGIILSQSYMQSQIDSIVNSMDSMAIQKYNADDTCLLIVNRFYRENKYGVSNTYKSSLSRPIHCSNDYLPVPNFYENKFRSEIAKQNLTSDFVLYVNKAEAGLFEENLKEQVGMYMPQNWRHGYSSGCAINDEKNIVLYWVVIW